jgi:hypothetical protein
MSRFIDIISPIYQELLSRCERKKITINLDIQDLTVKINDDEAVKDFYTTELKRALKLCEPGDKITVAQTVSDDYIRLSVKNSSNTLLAPDIVEKLRNDGYEVRSRFGYDTIISQKIAK